MADKLNSGILFLFYNGTKEGRSIKELCKLAHISKSTYYRWFKVGRRAYHEKKQGKQVDKYEEMCIRFYKVVNSAKRRRN